MQGMTAIPNATVAQQARYRLEELAAELPYAAPEDREAFYAGIVFERWLLESCQHCR